HFPRGTCFRPSRSVPLKGSALARSKATSPYPPGTDTHRPDPEFFPATVSAGKMPVRPGELAAKQKHQNPLRSRPPPTSPGREHPHLETAATRERIAAKHPHSSPSQLCLARRATRRADNRVAVNPTTFGPAAALAPSEILESASAACPSEHTRA